jgi:hypothetical protein
MATEILPSEQLLEVIGKSYSVEFNFTVLKLLDSARMDISEDEILAVQKL